uniref:Wall-associated receptor kinase galacturonan-binding domain-containing protein n=1 Tax=Oryza punctata TaxID=4537 RepID=A0A0E0LWK8_ORYPU
MASQETMSSSFSCLVAWLLLLLLLPPLFAAVDDGMRSGGGSGSNCTTSCGNVGFEYPFGVEDGCYRAGGFNLTCNYSYQPPRLFLGDGGGVQVLDISVPRGWALINNTRMVFNRTWDQLVVGGPYSLSGSNKITLVGCNARVDLRTQVKVKHGGGGGGGDDTSSNLISSCTAVCPSGDRDDIGHVLYAIRSGGGRADDSAACSGVGCCQASINLDISSSYTIQVQNLQQPGRSISPRDLVFITKEDFSYTSDMAFGNNIPEALPALLEWYISSNSSDCTTGAGPRLSQRQQLLPILRPCRCYCSDGYQGNPCVPGGCLGDYSCHGDCNNTPGSHICQCPRGYEGNASTPNGCKGT